jgi:hypothetical protein
MIHPPLKTHFPAPNAGQEKFNSHPVAPTCLALFELKMPVAITSPATMRTMVAIANPLYGWA